MIMKAILAAWRFFGSIHLTVVLCLLLTADLAWGYLCLDRHAPLFDPLNDVGLATWIATYGRADLARSSWLLVLMLLLAVLGANTFVCTTDRVVRLVRMRDRVPFRRLFFRFAPHVMHYAVIVILAGYLSSYLFARVLDTRVLVPGSALTLPDTSGRVLFESSDPTYYPEGGIPALEGRVLRPMARLHLTDGSKEKIETLNYNRPIRFKGYGIFLEDYYPRKKSGGMSDSIRINLSIRKDPGVRFYFSGIVLFTAGLAMYLADLVFLRRR
jgi:cytochrome c biogenesis protein ResB